MSEIDKIFSVGIKPCLLSKKMSPITIFSSSRPPTFYDLAEHGIPLEHAWHGTSIPPGLSFLFWLTPKHLHFLAQDTSHSALTHPEASPGQFQKELWKYDVAEFFLTSDDQSKYVEFNFSPNGAWWSSLFDSPRTPSTNQPLPDIITHAKQTPTSWQTHAQIPLDYLQQHNLLGPQSKINPTFILRSPEQIFITATDLRPGEPDFHQPHKFSPIKISTLA